MSKRAGLGAVLPALAGAVAFVLVLLATRPAGPGLDPDAVSYLSAARSLIDRGTLTVPTTDWEQVDSLEPLAHFPPGFPIALAIVQTVGADPITAARLVSASSAAVMLGIVTWLVTGAAGPLAALALAAALLATPAVADVHLAVLSEPLFLACLAATLALTVHADDRPWLAGTTAALATMVRYAGIALPAAVVVWTILRPDDAVLHGQLLKVPGRDAFRRRLRAAAIAALPTALLLGAWVGRTRRVAGRGAIREIAAYGGGIASTLREGAGTLRDWLAPSLDGAPSARVAFASILLLGLGATMLMAARRPPAERDVGSVADTSLPASARDSSALKLVLAATLIVVLYVAVVLLARLVADPGIPLDERLLAPAILLTELVIAVTLARSWNAITRPVRLAAGALLVIWAALSASQVIDNVGAAMSDGIDFAGARWRESSLAAWARTDPDHHPLFSNFPAALYFHARRAARLLPQEPDARELQAFGDTLRRRHGAVVAFSQPSAFVESPASLVRALGLRAIVQDSTGAVYVSPPDTLATQQVQPADTLARRGLPSER